MKIVRPLILGLALLLPATLPARDSLERGFLNPPESTRPWCYWYWISDHISRDGITKDLEAMRRVGIGEALIGNIYLDDTRIGDVKVLSEAWWEMVEHAVREGGRIGVRVGLFNCPGWSQSGGPWIKPEQAMRFVAFTERRVTGPGRFQELISAPREPFQDVALLAIPATPDDQPALSALNPSVDSQPAAQGLSRLADGDRESVFLVPQDAARSGSPFVIEFDVAQLLAARSLTLHPSATDFALQAELLVASTSGEFVSVRKFVVDRSNNNLSVGFRPHGPVSVSFPEVQGTKFRLVLSGMRGQPGLAEVELSGGARVERFIEKQLGKMHPTPLPMWDAYLWSATAPVESANVVIRPGAVQDITRFLAADGTLTWDVPPGDWVILRAGMTPTGMKNAPTSPEGQGLEVDKMNAQLARIHFDAYIGKLLERLPKADRKAFRHVVADSYEMGSQNWTEGMRELFQQRYGYDPYPWLPVLTGRVVGSADESDRFLWDLRRLVADRVSYGYVGGLREACNANGLLLWLENYGHWGFPGEFLQYGGQSDEVSGEFWSTGDLGSIELRAAASAAHTYGKPVVSAEAFTSVQKFESTPWSLKKRGDWALTEGVNHWVLHVNIHQPWEDRLPGVNAWFTTEFNRHNTWFDQSREWIDYYRRCHFLLQQGKHVADVAYFIGEDTPKMTGVRDPELPAGYNFDYINAEVIQQRLKVKNGRFVLPDGMSYRLLVLPRLDTMRPELLRKLRDLVAAGGVILGDPPSRSPSRQNFPQCDAEVRALAHELWGTSAHSPEVAFSLSYRKGRVFRSAELQSVLDALQIPPQVSEIDPRRILWTHRAGADAEIFFLSNQSEQTATIAPVFRSSGRIPEIWDPATRDIRKSPLFAEAEQGTRVPVQLEPRGSVFVVFRDAAGRRGPVARLLENGLEIIDASTAAVEPRKNPAAAPPAGEFTIATWVKPSTEIGLPPEADSGVQLHQSRNELVTAFHGDNRYPEGGHAGAGLSVGLNGVVVYEHSGNYYASLLVHRVRLDDWTHLAVVYQGGQPRLYLDGKRVHQGVHSRYLVHPGTEAEPGGNPAFKGEFASLAEFQYVLDDAEIARLAAARPEGSDSPVLWPVSLALEGRQMVAEAWRPGAFALVRADGHQALADARALPAAETLQAAWQVDLSASWDQVGPITVEKLESLTAHPNPAVRHFAGTAAYRCRFQIAPERLRLERRVWLDLGKVESVAEVIVNGKNLGTYWKPPYRVDITSVARGGDNTLEVRVTGTWRNRLIGDAKYPGGFPEVAASGVRPFKPYLTANIGVKVDEPLAPFGLIGPVRLHSSERVTLKFTSRSTP